MDPSPHRNLHPIISGLILLQQVQKKLREAANSFCPAEGSAPSDAPQASRGRGRGKGRGRGRSNKKESGGDDGDDGANEPGEAASSDADLDQEDAKLKEDLSEGEDKPAAPGKEATPKKKPGSRKRRAAKTPTGKTPPKRKRRTPKLKRALKATHEGELDSSLQTYSNGETMSQIYAILNSKRNKSISRLKLSHLS